MMRTMAVVSVLMVGLVGAGHAQDRMSATEYAAQTSIPAGTAPGLKATELNTHTRSFRLIFAKGDDVRGGLLEFAAKNHLTDARFTAIGALDSAVIGWSDRP